MEFDAAIDRLRGGLETSSAAEAADFAAAFAASFPPDFALTLSGDLGTGKTNFAKGLARGLGITETVKSPSFNICCIYDIPDGRKFVHIDAYRLSSPEAFDDLLIDEIAHFVYRVARSRRSGSAAYRRAAETFFGRNDPHRKTRLTRQPLRQKFAVRK